MAAGKPGRWRAGGAWRRLSADPRRSHSFPTAALARSRPDRTACPGAALRRIRLRQELPDHRPGLPDRDGDAMARPRYPGRPGRLRRRRRAGRLRPAASRLAAAPRREPRGRIALHGQCRRRYRPRPARHAGPRGRRRGHHAATGDPGHARQVLRPRRREQHAGYDPVRGGLRRDPLAMALCGAAYPPLGPQRQDAQPGQLGPAGRPGRRVPTGTHRRWPAADGHEDERRRAARPHRHAAGGRGAGRHRG